VQKGRMNEQKKNYKFAFKVFVQKVKAIIIYHKGQGSGATTLNEKI
jgi:hypothetical protein